MKRFVAFLLVLSMALGLSVFSYAESEDAKNEIPDNQFSESAFCAEPRQKMSQRLSDNSEELTVLWADLVERGAIVLQDNGMLRLVNDNRIDSDYYDCILTIINSLNDAVMIEALSIDFDENDKLHFSIPGIDEDQLTRLNSLYNENPNAFESFFNVHKKQADEESITARSGHGCVYPSMDLLGLCETNYDTLETYFHSLEINSSDPNVSIVVRWAFTVAFWVNQVRENGPWDYKNNGLYGEYDTYHCSYYDGYYHHISAEKIGNFNYGYTGSFLFPLPILYGGSVAVEYLSEVGDSLLVLFTVSVVDDIIATVDDLLTAIEKDSHDWPDIRDGFIHTAPFYTRFSNNQWGSKFGAFSPYYHESNQNSVFNSSYNSSVTEGEAYLETNTSFYSQNGNAVPGAYSYQRKEVYTTGNYLGSSHGWYIEFKLKLNMSPVCGMPDSHPRTSRTGFVVNVRSHSLNEEFYVCIARYNRKALITSFSGNRNTLSNYRYVYLSDIDPYDGHTYAFSYDPNNPLTIDGYNYYVKLFVDGELKAGFDAPTSRTIQSGHYYHDYVGFSTINRSENAGTPDVNNHCPAHTIAWLNDIVVYNRPY